MIKYSTKISKSNILKLSIPIFFANFAIPLAGLVDTGLMGHQESEKFLAATSISTSFISMLLWSFGFLRMGTTSLVAQSFGKRDYREIVSIISRAIILAFIIAIVIIIFKNPILYIANHFFEVSQATKFLINEYISVRIYSAPAELMIYVLVGFFLGIQKTYVSSLIVSFYSLVNIIFSSYLVIVMELGINGVALGTVLSAYLTIFIFLLYSYFFIIKNFKVIPKFKNLFIRKKIFQLININFDIFIRTILITFSFLWFTYQSSLLGEDYLATNSILLQFIIFSAFFLYAYANSTEGLVGFAVGRKSERSFLKITKLSFELSFFTSLIISIIFIFFSKSIINGLTNLDFVIYMSYGYVFWIIIIPPVASFCYQFDGIFLGASQTSEMRNCMFVSVVLFILSSLYCTKLLGNHGLWLSLFLFMIFRSFTLNMFFYKIIKKLK